MSIAGYFPRALRPTPKTAGITKLTVFAGLPTRIASAITTATTRKTYTIK
jgi:hypothetical protein